MMKCLKAGSLFWVVTHLYVCCDLPFWKCWRFQWDFSPALALDWVRLNSCIFSYSDEAPAAPTGGMDINTALQEVLKMALTHGSLAHGLHEAAKALDK